MINNSILEVENVYQAFRTGFWGKRKQILENVSFSLPRKSIVGFLGANGAGKTTMIQLIVGLKHPVSGVVKVAGQEAWTRESRSMLGYLPERPYFHEHLTGAGLLRYLGILSGMSLKDIKARTPAVLAKVGMSAARDVELKRYSKGMLQRIGIAQALLHNPEFLVLDEPMSGLDPVGRKEIRELIVHLASEGRSIFFSSHIIPDVEAICDQVVVIKKGKLIGSGMIGQFLAQGKLQSEIAFTGGKQDNSLLKEFVSVRSIPDGGMRGIVSGQQASSVVLKKLLENGATILWVNPIRPSLEDLFEEKEL